MQGAVAGAGDVFLEAAEESREAGAAAKRDHPVAAQNSIRMASGPFHTVTDNRFLRATE